MVESEDYAAMKQRFLDMLGRARTLEETLSIIRAAMETEELKYYATSLLLNAFPEI